MTMRRFYVCTGAIAAVFFLIALFYTLRMDWIPAANFDVLGVLWLMQNLPRLGAILISFVLGALTLFCFGRAVTARGSAVSDQATEARFRERFGSF